MVRYEAHKAVPAQLAAAIDRLYREFAGYRLGDAIVGSKVVTYEREEWLLASLPIPEIPRRLMGRYIDNAIHLWGTVEDFKCFLPYLFEVAALDNVYAHGGVPVFEGLRYGDWWSWPPSERNAIVEYMDALWAHHRENPMDIGAVVYSVAVTHTCMSAPLERWVTDPRNGAVDSLVAFAYLNCEYLRLDGRLDDGAGYLWDKRRAQEVEIVQWLTGPRVSEFFRVHEPDIKPLGSCVAQLWGD